MSNNNDLVFVSTKQTYGTLKGEQVILSNPGDGAPDYSTSGTLQEWQDEIGQYCVGNSRPAFACCLPLAAPLLRQTGGEGGGVNLVGQSSDGKTTAMYVAASVAGPPEGQIKTCDSTANAFESTAAQHNDSCLLLDELGQAHPEQIGQIVYKLVGGIGRGRADQHGNAKERRLWRILFLTTGETDLTNMMASAGKRSFAGQELRLADIEADAGHHMGIFETLHDFTEPSALADHLKEASARYHGTVLDSYLNKLVAEMKDPKQRAKCLVWIVDVQTRFMKAALPSGVGGQTHRVAKRFSLVAAGGELATFYGLTGWPQGEATTAALKCFESWLSRRGTAGHAEVDKLIQQVTAFFERHTENRFTPMNSKSKRPTPNRAGFRRPVPSGLDVDNHVNELFVLPATFRDELCAGFDNKWAAKVLIERGLLKPANDKKPQSVHRLPGLGATRCYHFPAQNKEVNANTHAEVEY